MGDNSDEVDARGRAGSWSWSLRNASCRLTPLAVTEMGWDRARLQQASAGAALAYLIPDFQNPTGLCMTEEVRERVRLECPVVVDETMADLSLDGPPARPFGAFHANVITIGSVSKTFWGGLRVGWLPTSDRELVQRVIQARPGSDLGTPIVEQLATARLLNGIEAFLPRRLDELRGKRAALRSLIAEFLPGWSPWPSAGGLSVWARLPRACSSALAAAGPAFGVQLAAGRRFGVGGVFERFVRIPHCLDREALERGVAALQAMMSHLATDAESPVVPSEPVV